jgi:hypothetical protein
MPDDYVPDSPTVNNDNKIWCPQCGRDVIYTKGEGEFCGFCGWQKKDAPPGKGES